MSHRIMVISNSTIVEPGDASEVYANARHPYTRRLLAAANLRPRRHGAQHDHEFSEVLGVAELHPAD